MDGLGASRAWLRNRVDQDIERALRELLTSMTESAATASGNAVTVRELSDDGLWLRALAAHHVDPTMSRAMAAIMDETAQRADIGLWRPVVEDGRPVRYRLDGRRRPVEASDGQARFLDRFPVTAVVAVPLLTGGRVVGGASLVRFTVDRDFSDGEEALLVEFADRVGMVLGWLKELAGPA
ncbi:GAF domain-containing protein [Pseudonocardia dioxanivorans]|uniref:GAF domain-containing protein n=1 Tax=Pseudonocardia dioxanivorans TaxID=240495 RepID=UPI001049E2B9|nr:GAF domain-containing protein [Pseudonocardia dioxanivorans]